MNLLHHNFSCMKYSQVFSEQHLDSDRAVYCVESLLRLAQKLQT